MNCNEKLCKLLISGSEEIQSLVLNLIGGILTGPIE